jgi:FemAB-related protein (PEP-CTERM system-associated)
MPLVTVLSATCRIRLAEDPDRELWDRYVDTHAQATPYHRFAWRDVVCRAYGHRACYLIATRAQQPTEALGVLPLFHLKSAIFGNAMASLPFVDAGGALAADPGTEMELLAEAGRLARTLGAKDIDLRCEHASAACESGALALPVARRPGKVRMLLFLPGSSAELFKSFKAKLRSQISRPVKEGCTCTIGGLELLEDFYKVFLINMRDLGSPVHSKELMRHVLEAFPEHSRIFAVHHAGRPIAASLVIGFNGVLRNPWASSDRRYAAMSPNMLLYSRMLEYACDAGYRTFDFGRSTPGEGTYRFKEQWGARPAPLHWYVIAADGKPPAAQESPAERFRLAARLWSKLPVPVTRVLGPRIRKHISL